MRARPDADRRRYEISPEIQVEWEAMRAALRRRRLDMGLTQADLSKAMGRSDDFVSVLENQSSNPNVATVMLWIGALGGSLVPEW
jgi:transcriptional regulator with XRE-family HTH domain